MRSLKRNYRFKLLSTLFVSKENHCFFFKISELSKDLMTVHNSNESFAEEINGSFKTIALNVWSPINDSILHCVLFSKWNNRNPNLYRMPHLLRFVYSSAHRLSYARACGPQDIIKFHSIIFSESADNTG